MRGLFPHGAGMITGSSGVGACEGDGFGDELLGQFGALTPGGPRYSG
jgi:hypothetical protein